MGVRQRIQDGGWIGGPTPAGCKVVGEAGKKMLEVDPVTSPIVSQIWSMVANGATLNDVAVYLTEGGIAPPRKKGWRPATVNSLLRQVRLIGLLVSDETFNAAQAVLQSRSCPARPKGGIRLSSQSRTDRPWPLVNLARCAECGGSMFGYSTQGKLGTHYFYLRCTNRTKKLCKAPDLAAPVWEAAVCKAMQMVLCDEGPYAERLNGTVVELQRRASTRQADMDVVIKERDGVQARIGRLLDLAEAGEVTSKSIADRLKPLENESAALDLKLAEMEGLSSAAHIDGDSVQTLLEQMQAGSVGLDSRTPEEQKLILNSLLVEVQIGLGKPIGLSMWMPDLMALAGSKGTQQTKEPMPTGGVSSGGHGFAWSSSLVEAEGIEPSSEHVRTPRLRV